MPAKAVIWDLDGTLLDTGAPLLMLVITAFTRLTLPVAACTQPDEILKYTIAYVSLHVHLRALL